VPVSVMLQQSAAPRQRQTVRQRAWVMPLQSEQG